MIYNKPVIYRDKKEYNQHTNPGSEIHDLYMEDVLPDGTRELKKVGSENIQEAIQSHRDSCDIKEILKRHEMLGTVDQLIDRGNGYLDLSTMPKNLHEVKMLLNNAENAYNSLKDEVKEKYPTIDSFLANFGNLNSFAQFLKENSVEVENGGDDSEINS